MKRTTATATIAEYQDRYSTSTANCENYHPSTHHQQQQQHHSHHSSSHHHVVCSVCSNPIEVKSYNFDLRLSHEPSVADKMRYVPSRSISPPSRRSYPFAIGAHRLLGSHLNKTMYTRPLSPVNYEFFKARYKTQLRYLDAQGRPINNYK